MITTLEHMLYGKLKICIGIFDVGRRFKNKKILHLFCF